MNTVARIADYTAQPDRRFVRHQPAAEFLFSGRGPVRRVQIEAVMQRSRLLLGAIEGVAESALRCA